MATDDDGTSVDCMDTTRYAPKTLDYEHFFAAVRSNDTATVDKALESNIDINLLEGNPPNGDGAIHIATGLGSSEMVKFLLSRGADVNLQDSEPCGPSFALHYASFRPNPDVMEVLLDQGAKVEGLNPVESTPLTSVLWIKNAIRTEYREAIKLLVEHNADIYAVQESSGETVVSLSGTKIIIEADDLSLPKPQN